MPRLQNVANYWGVDANVFDMELRTTTLVIQKQPVLRDLNKRSYNTKTHLHELNMRA